MNNHNNSNRLLSDCNSINKKKPPRLRQTSTTHIRSQSEPLLKNASLLPPLSKQSSSRRRTTSTSTITKNKKRPASLSTINTTSLLTSSSSSDSQQIKQNTIPDIICHEVILLHDMNPGQTTDMNISLALTDFTRTMYQSTIDRLDRTTLLKDPNAFLPNFIKGVCHYYLDDLENAKKDFTICCACVVGRSSGGGGGGTEGRKKINKGQRSEYEKALAFFNRSIVWMKLNRVEQSMEDIDKAICLYPFEQAFFSNRALLFRRLGNFESAQEDYAMRRTLLVDDPVEGGVDSEKTKGNNEDHHRLSLLSMRISPDCLLALPVQSPFSIPRKRSQHQKAFYAPMSNMIRSPLELISGDIHDQCRLMLALKCPPQKRTKEQINLLIQESKMMPAFVTLDSTQIKTLWQYFEYKDLPSTDMNILFVEREFLNDNFYILIWSGMISVKLGKQSGFSKPNDEALEKDDECIVHVIRSGQCLSDFDILDKGEMIISCKTLEPTEILILKGEHFRQTIQAFDKKSIDDKVSFISSYDFLSHWTGKFFIYLSFHVISEILFHLMSLICAEMNSESQIEELARNCRETRYHRGETITRQVRVQYIINSLKSFTVL